VRIGRQALRQQLAGMRAVFESFGNRHSGTTLHRAYQLDKEWTDRLHENGENLPRP
jgi:hypothetical protein